MSKIKETLMILRHIQHNDKILKDEKYLSHRLEAEIIRNVHSIEKGLSLEQPKKLFGIKKINAMLKYMEQYSKLSDISEVVMRMAADAMNAYFSFHGDKDYPELIPLKNNADVYIKQYSDDNSVIRDGGVVQTSFVSREEDYQNLLSLANQRHSIRDFSGDSVPMDKLKKALEIAQRAPSACNRQGVRAYVISGENKNCLNGWLEGTGGFSDSVDKYILITGRLTTYRKDEPFQYIVSASIFAGYLALALQSVGIGACIIQRPVLYNNQWVDVAKKLNIPEDEQAVLMIGTGMPKDEYTVPVSKRLPYDEQIKEL